MNINVINIQNITYSIYLLYFFIETKIYIMLWVGIFYALIITRPVFIMNIILFKSLVALYVIVVIVGYVYQFWQRLRHEQDAGASDRLKILLLDKKKKIRLSIVAVIFIIINIVVIYAR